MQDTEKIDYDNYEFMYDKNGYSRGEGIPIFKDVFDFYNVIGEFVLVEIINKQKDFSELGKYLDYNLAYNSNQSVDFLHYLYFVYEPYFNKDLTDYRVSWIEEFYPVYQFEIADYIKIWINGKVRIIGKNSLDEIGRGLIVNEMYATLPTKTISTPLPEAEDKQPTNERGAYKDEADIMEELDKFRNAVLDICDYIKGLPNSQIPTIAKIKSDALSSSGLTERQVTRNVKISTSLIKTGLLTETTTGHICQIVGQFFKGNNLVLKKLKLLV